MTRRRLALLFVLVAAIVLAGAVAIEPVRVLKATLYQRFEVRPWPEAPMRAPRPAWRYRVHIYMSPSRPGPPPAT